MAKIICDECKKTIDIGKACKERHYKDGIVEYLSEKVGEEHLTNIQFWSGDRKGRDRDDRPEYNVKMNIAFCFSNKFKILQAIYFDLPFSNVFKTTIFKHNCFTFFHIL